MVRVKICGITNWKDAKAACDLGADALGFNFYEKSVRNIAPADAWAIRKKLPPFVAAVGVFVNWSPPAVQSLSRSLQLTAAQLHGEEVPKDVAAVAIPVIKALRVGPKFNLAELQLYKSYAFLLDADKSGEYGGTGQRTDWKLAAKAARSHTVILAGGLTPENVFAAIQFVRPYAVDVASGVESKSGKKDLGRMRAFLIEVHRANAQP